MKNQKESTGFIISFKKVYSFYIAALPLLMIFRFPFTEYGLGIILSFFFLPYVLISSINTKKRGCVHNYFLTLFFSYIIIRSVNDITSVVLFSVAAIHIILSSKTTDYEVIRNTIIRISIIASVIIIIQRVLSIFGLNVSFFFNHLMIDEFSDTSSVYSGQSLTRFSGIFAEPSHYAEYALIGLILLMVNYSHLPQKHYCSVFVISVGLLGSTSGIGLLGLVGVWGFYYLFCSKRLKKLPMLLRVLFLIVLLLLSFVILLQIPTIRVSFFRVFGWVDGYNAYAGRSVFSQMYLDQLTGSSMIWGLGVQEMGDYAVGAIRIIFQYGCVGLALLLIAMLCYICWGNRVQKVISIVYTGFLFVAGLVGMLNYMFYLSLITVVYNCSLNHRR